MKICMYRKACMWHKGGKACEKRREEKRREEKRGEKEEWHGESMVRQNPCQKEE